MKIAIVGGGTAGLIAALILKTKFKEKQVDVVSSSQIGAIGVGEGSTEHWKEFMQFVGIDQYDLIKNSDAVLKYGIKFTNWTDTPYYHCVQSPYNVKYGQYRALYGKVIGNRGSWEEIISPATINGYLDKNIYGTDKFVSNQYHFNTFKLNDYLRQICIDKGIVLYDDIIEDITVDGQGNIDKISSKSKTYDYDFYIDSTGFKKLLIGKLGAKWKSYSNHLLVNSAIVFPTTEQDSIPLMTSSHAMDYGWFFRSPVWGRFGNGYIFDSNFISVDDANKEVNKYFGKEIEPAKHINFDPGALDKTWIKNCVAIGLTSNFIEPLEASSIGSTIHQTFLLMHRLENYNQKTIDSYNSSVNDIMTNILEFVTLHYLTKKTNTKFWIDSANVELPGTLKDKLEIWKHQLPIQEDFKGLSNYILYNEQNFTLVMNGLDLFDRNSIKKEYESCSSLMKEQVDQIICQRNNDEQWMELVLHKEYINRIREETL